MNWAPSQLVPSSQQVGGALQASGGSMELAQPTPPRPTQHEWQSGGELPCLCTFQVLRGDGEPLDWPPLLLESDSVTTLCPNCGVSSKYRPLLSLARLLGEQLLPFLSLCSLPGMRRQWKLLKVGQWLVFCQAPSRWPDSPPRSAWPRCSPLA